MNPLSDGKMDAEAKALWSDYSRRTLGRREFLTRLIGATGSMAAAHLLLERGGWAAEMTQAESKQVKVTSSTVQYASGDQQISAALSLPAGSSQTSALPAIVVIHENRGLNEHIRDVARRFASEGFVALAPDLLSRKGGTGSMKTPDEARTAIGTIAPEDALADLRAGLTFLESQPQVARGKLAVAGFCWGGARSFLLAAADERLKASVVFYGSTPPTENIAQIKCPVLGLYGETDQRITSRVPATFEAMKEAGKTFQYHIYAGAGHAFFNDTGPNFNAQAAQDAWTRTLSFVRGNLS